MCQSLWDTWGPIAVNVVAVLVAAAIAVWGAIRGAQEGAKYGAQATLEATSQAIAADREAAREQRRRQSAIAVRALATECKLNANALLAERKYMPDPRFLTPLRQSALDAATAEIAALPEEVQREVLNVLDDVLWFNRLVASRIAVLTPTGEGVSRALLNELTELGRSLPSRLEGLAATFEAEAMRDSENDRRGN